MYFLLGLFLFGTFGTIDSEIFSLNYIYTALSKPVDLPGIHVFSAIGLLNDKMIDYYDSVDRVKIPKQDWMKERNEENYWKKGTESRKSKEQWFKVNVGILMERMRHNKSDLHVLQWIHGCKIDKLPDGSVKFLDGTDGYSYDGDDFLSFNEGSMQWVAPVDQAVPTKRKWDGVQILNQYTKGYLEKECVDWLTKFMKYEEEITMNSPQDTPPEVHAFAKKSRTPDKIILTCLATGFYPKDIELNIWMNEVPLTVEDGVTSTGVRPNHDDTYQIRKAVEISATDKNDYTCIIKHRTLKEPLIVTWDGTFSDPNSPTTIIIVAVMIVMLISISISVIFIMIVLRKKKRIGEGSNEALQNAEDGSSTGSTDSGKGSNEELQNAEAPRRDEAPGSGPEQDSLLENNGE